MSENNLRQTRFEQSSQRLRVKNTSSETVPPFGVMAIVDVTREGEDDGLGYGPLTYEIRKPNAEDEKAQLLANLVFNIGGPIPAGKFGRGTQTVPCYAYVDSNVDGPFQGVGPIADEWKLFRGGCVLMTRKVFIVVEHEDAVEADPGPPQVEASPEVEEVKRALLIPREGIVEFRTKGAGVPAKSSNDYGEGVVELYYDDDGTRTKSDRGDGTAIELSVRHFGVKVNGNTNGFASLVNDKWMITGLYC